jgi:hypothetical protein
MDNTILKLALAVLLLAALGTTGTASAGMPGVNLHTLLQPDDPDDGC